MKYLLKIDLVCFDGRPDQSRLSRSREALQAIEHAILEAMQTHTVLIASAREDLKRYEVFTRVSYDATRQEARMVRRG